MNITFVTSAQTDEEGYALLKEFGYRLKTLKKTDKLCKGINESTRNKAC